MTATQARKRYRVAEEAGIATAATAAAGGAAAVAAGRRVQEGSTAPLWQRGVHVTAVLAQLHPTQVPLQAQVMGNVRSD